VKRSKKKKEELKFSYVVAHYWEGTSGNIGTYTYFGEVHYGTMKDAEGFLEY